MTQHYEQDAEPAAAMPPQPSPYLQPGQIPDAYPAPPQPGRPGFGAAPGQARQAPRAAGYARPAGSRGDPALAERWRRFVGWLLDTLVVSLIASPLFVPAAMKFGRRFEQILSQYHGGPTTQLQTEIGNAVQSMAGSLYLAALAVVAISFLYYWLLTAFWGTTLGKRAVGTMVVTAAGRSKVGVLAAAIRAGVFVLLQVVPTIGLFLFLADNGWLLFDTSLQCLHDKAARTVVVKRAYQQAQPSQQPW
jgi:uncharacterized RDD family membrane protein YckC